MRSRLVFFSSIVVALVLVSISLVSATDSRAADTGTLKLKVRPCYSSNWINNAYIDVTVYRPGTGTVDSATGYTNSSGYVEFTFYSLEGGDQAQVTVTPSGMKSDSSHTYYWVPGQGRAHGEWDLGIFSDSMCDDGWFDQTNNILLCLYH